MAKSFLEGLKRFLAMMKTNGELPRNRAEELEAEVLRLENEEDDYLDAQTGNYTLEWAKKMGDLQAKMIFYRLLFSKRDRKFVRIFRIIAKGEYEPIEGEPADEIKELVIYSYVSASREYGLLDEVFHDPEWLRQRPLFRREVYDKFFVETLYDKLGEYAVEVLEFWGIHLTAQEREKLNNAVSNFKQEHPKEEYLTNLLPLNNA